MLMPKRVKHRKVQRGRMKGKATRGNFLAYGDFGIQATTCGWLTSNQIEAARIAINRYIKRGGKLWIKVFPDKPVSKKPAETRMGKGRRFIHSLNNNDWDVKKAVKEIKGEIEIIN